MAAELSRRALFRALRAEPGREDAGREATISQSVARIGKACVEPKGVMCRRCADECDVRAIRFRLTGRGRAQPVLDVAVCTGCSACVAVCPVQAIDLVPVERAALIAGLVEISRAS